MICVEHDGGIFEKKHTRQLGGMQVSMHAAVMRVDWDLCTVCDDRLRPGRSRETGLPDWQLRQHLRGWNLRVRCHIVKLALFYEPSFFSPVLSTTTTTTTTTPPPHDSFFSSFLFPSFPPPPPFFFISFFYIFLYFFRSKRRIRKKREHIYNYTMVKVRLFCWWCCVCCIVVLTLCFLLRFVVVLFCFSFFLKNLFSFFSFLFEPAMTTTKLPLVGWLKFFLKFFIWKQVINCWGVILRSGRP